MTPPITYTHQPYTHPEIFDPETDFLNRIGSLEDTLSEFTQRMRITDRSLHALHTRIESTSQETRGQIQTINTELTTISGQMKEIWEKFSQPIPPPRPDNTEEIQKLRNELSQANNTIHNLQREFISFRTQSETQQKENLSSLQRSLGKKIDELRAENKNLRQRMNLLEQRIQEQNNLSQKRDVKHENLQTVVTRLTEEMGKTQTQHTKAISSLQAAISKIKNILEKTSPPPKSQTAPATPPDINDDAMLEAFNKRNEPVQAKPKPIEKRENIELATLNALTQFLENPYESPFSLKRRSLSTRELVNASQKVVIEGFLNAQKNGKMERYLAILRTQDLELVLVEKATNKQYPLPFSKEPPPKDDQLLDDFEKANQGKTVPLDPQEKRETLKALVEFLENPNGSQWNLKIRCLTKEMQDLSKGKPTLKIPCPVTKEIKEFSEEETVQLFISWHNLGRMQNFINLSRQAGVEFVLTEKTTEKKHPLRGDGFNFCLQPSSG